jgi:hypothetical protein
LGVCGVYMWEEWLCNVLVFNFKFDCV